MVSTWSLRPCTEANTLLRALHTLPKEIRAPLRATLHGDAFNDAFLRGLTPDYREMILELLRKRSPPAGECVVVCHSEPGAWSPPRYNTAPCPPQGYGKHAALRVVGRTMFETDRLAKEHVERCNRMVGLLRNPGGL